LDASGQPYTGITVVDTESLWTCRDCAVDNVVNPYDWGAQYRTYWGQSHSIRLDLGSTKVISKVVVVPTLWDKQYIAGADVDIRTDSD